MSDISAVFYKKVCRLAFLIPGKPLRKPAQKVTFTSSGMLGLHIRVVLTVSRTIRILCIVLRDGLKTRGLKPLPQMKNKHQTPKGVWRLDQVNKTTILVKLIALLNCFKLIKIKETVLFNRFKPRNFKFNSLFK